MEMQFSAMPQNAKRHFVIEHLVKCSSPNFSHTSAEMRECNDIGFPLHRSNYCVAESLSHRILFNRWNFALFYLSRSLYRLHNNRVKQDENISFQRM